MAVFSLTNYLESILTSQAATNGEVALKPGQRNFKLFTLFLEGRAGSHNYDIDRQEFLFLARGRATVKSGAKSLKMKAGNALLLVPTTRVQIVPGKNALLLKMRFSPQVGLPEKQALNSVEQKMVQRVRTILHQDHCLLLQNKLAMKPAQLFAQVIDSYLSEDLFSAYLAQAQLLAAWVYSLRAQRFMSLSDVSQIVFEKSTLDSYIDAHYVDASLSEAAKYFGFNVNYFSSMVKEKTGQSFMDHVNERRMIEARRLLAKPDLSLQEIIHQVGYSSKSFFYKKFNEYYGLTPAALRQQLFTQANINLR